MDGYGLNLYIFGKKGPDPVGKEFGLVMCLLNVFKLWPAKRLAGASSHSPS